MKQMKQMQLFEVVVWTLDEDGNRVSLKTEWGEDVIATSLEQAARKVNAQLAVEDIDRTEVEIRPFAR